MSVEEIIKNIDSPSSVKKFINDELSKRSTEAVKSIKIDPNNKSNLTELAENKGSEKEIFLKIKKMTFNSLKKFATEVGVPDEVIKPIKRDNDVLIDEIMGELFDDKWERTLIKQGVL